MARKPNRSLLPKERRAERPAIIFTRWPETANLALRLQALDLDRLGELVDGDVARVVADFQPQVYLPRAAGIVLPEVLARVGQARRDRREAPIGPIAN